MKKVLTLVGVFLLVSLSSFSQLTVNQSVTPTTGLKVGDTIQQIETFSQSKNQ